ncbi:UNKNOWN [Stylonychia lemnae]|uniref:Uncharacterized protein n=1 Tax=Stylonychia lemnae TaxID=5949 RepID=A0A077ZW42_STYLE|nr:UNKNOWN [Stylonychia lemnae]|eukprot:CDW72666.1 UNKNOWN [Stylonychia lemnae]
MVIAIILAGVAKQRPLNTNVYLVYGGTLGWQLLVILLTYRFPTIFTMVHAPLISIGYWFNCLIQFLSPVSYVAVMQTTLGLEFFLICGLVLNFCWYITSIVLILNLALGIVMLFAKFQIEDVGVVAQYVMTTLFIIYAMYLNESSNKNEFIRLIQNEKMNKELQSLLMNLPNPMLLFDQENNQVVLGNIELNKLLSINDEQDKQLINLRMTSQIFQPYNNYIEGLGDSDRPSDQCLNIE